MGGWSDLEAGTKGELTEGKRSLLGVCCVLKGENVADSGFVIGNGCCVDDRMGVGFLKELDVGNEVGVEPPLLAELGMSFVNFWNGFCEVSFFPKELPGVGNPVSSFGWFGRKRDS